jgi:hypothetical protein
MLLQSGGGRIPTPRNPTLVTARDREEMPVMPSAPIRTPVYRTSEDMLKRHFLADSRRLAFTGKTATQAKAWQRRARRRFAQLLGLPRFTRCAPRAQRVDRVQLDGLVREEWLMRTERDVWMPFSLLLPDPLPRQRLPLVLCPHGHASGGRLAPTGRSDVPRMAETITQYRYDYGVQIARAGFITACPDARGFGERREPVHQREEELLSSSCYQLTLAGAPLGLTVQGMWTWDLMRLLDVLERDTRVDRRRIGCAGLSGGGMQTLDLAALDERVQVAVVSGYFYGVRESLQVQNWHCMCNLVPGLWQDFDMGDLGALIAPRPLLIETGDADALNGPSKLGNVEPQLAIARRAYRALGAPDQLGQAVFSGPHRWDGAEAIPWLRRRLGA